MANKLKTCAILTLLVIGLVFLGIGCAEKNNGGSSPAQETSSEEAHVQKTTAAEATQGATSGEVQSISLKGSDTVLPLAQAEAEEFMNKNSGKSVTVTGGGSGVGILRSLTVK